MTNLRQRVRCLDWCRQHRSCAIDLPACSGEIRRNQQRRVSHRRESCDDTRRCMNIRPEISVLMPVYNAQATVARALNSVLRQSFVDFEVIVINDGSGDASEQIVREVGDPRMRIITHTKNQGLVQSLNEGLDLARGELVARHDADDESLPDRFHLQRAAMIADRSLGAVGGTLLLTRHGRAVGDAWRYPLTAVGSRWQIHFKTPAAHSAVMYRRNAVISAGGYQGGYPRAEDFELWSRVIKVSNIRNLRRPVLRYSIDDAGVSRSGADEQRSTHLRIATDNIKALLGKEIPRDIVETLALRIDRGEKGQDYSHILEAADACIEIFSRFKDGEEQSIAFKEVRADYKRRLTGLARSLPQDQRREAAREIGRMAGWNGLTLRWFTGISAFN